MTGECEIDMMGATIGYFGGELCVKFSNGSVSCLLD